GVFPGAGGRSRPGIDRAAPDIAVGTTGGGTRQHTRRFELVLGNRCRDRTTAVGGVLSILGNSRLLGRRATMAGGGGSAGRCTVADGGTCESAPGGRQYCGASGGLRRCVLVDQRSVDDIPAVGRSTPDCCFARASRNYRGAAGRVLGDALAV